MPTCLNMEEASLTGTFCTEIAVRNKAVCCHPATPDTPTCSLHRGVVVAPRLTTKITTSKTLGQLHPIMMLVVPSHLNPHTHMGTPHQVIPATEQATPSLHVQQHGVHHRATWQIFGSYHIYSNIRCFGSELLPCKRHQWHTLTPVRHCLLRECFGNQLHCTPGRTCRRKIRQATCMHPTTALRLPHKTPLTMCSHALHVAAGSCHHGRVTLPDQRLHTTSNKLLHTTTKQSTKYHQDKQRPNQ